MDEQVRHPRIVSASPTHLHKLASAHATKNNLDKYLTRKLRRKLQFLNDEGLPKTLQNSSPKGFYHKARPKIVNLKNRYHIDGAYTYLDFL